MIISAVHIDQGGLEVGTDLGKDRTKSLDGIAVEHLAAILCHKYQVYMNLENTMSSVSYILVICHRPNYNVLLKRLQTFKFETRPSGQQKQRLRRFAGSRRFVFNRALAFSPLTLGLPSKDIARLAHLVTLLGVSPPSTLKDKPRPT